MGRAPGDRGPIDLAREKARTAACKVALRKRWPPPALMGRALADRSTIYFPLRSNASGLFAGPGVAGVRRRILAAALLLDRVILEDGLHTAWSSSTGGATMTSHSAPAEWQTPRQRGRLTGTRHHVAMRSSNAPEDAPFHAVIVGDAAFSWHATFEPFRRELPASAARWLDFGHVQDDRPAKDVVRAWQRADDLEAFRRHLRGPRPDPPEEHFVHKAILEAGYYDLAIAAVTRSAVSIDRRHALALRTRVMAGDAHRLSGPYALEVLLPVGFTWADVPDLRKHRALRAYRAIVREIEEEALRTGGTVKELDERIRRDYENRVDAASTRGVPFTGRATLTAVGFVLGAAADTVAPMVGGAAVAAATFAATEALNVAQRPRWLAIDRRIRGTRNGL